MREGLEPRTSGRCSVEEGVEVEEEGALCAVPRSAAAEGAAQ